MSESEFSEQAPGKHPPSLALLFPSILAFPVTENTPFPNTWAYTLSRSTEGEMGPRSAHRILASAHGVSLGSVPFPLLPLEVLRVALGFLQYAFFFLRRDFVQQDTFLASSLAIVPGR